MFFLKISIEKNRSNTHGEMIQWHSPEPCMNSKIEPPAKVREGLVLYVMGHISSEINIEWLTWLFQKMMNGELDFLTCQIRNRNTIPHSLPGQIYWSNSNPTVQALFDLNYYCSFVLILFWRFHGRIFRFRFNFKSLYFWLPWDINLKPNSIERPGYGDCIFWSVGSAQSGLC